MFEIFIYLLKVFAPLKKMFGKPIIKIKEEILETPKLNFQTDTGLYNYKLERIIERHAKKEHTAIAKLKFWLLFKPIVKIIAKRLAILDYDDNKDRAAAEKGDHEAQYRLANAYMDGLLINKNYDEALRWYSSASDSGHAGAKFRIAMMYGNGLGVATDKDAAVKWCEEAAELKNLQAQIALAQIYDFEEPYVNQDKALKWYREVAEKGYANAQNELARKYDSIGKYKEAFEWFRKSAERANIFARHNLGVYYEEGCYVKKDINKAKEWYKLAAERGNAESQYELGRVYYYNERDIKAAELWFKKSAKQNYKNAYYKLGLISHQKKNFKASKKYLKKEKTMTIRAEYMLDKYDIAWRMNDSEFEKHFFAIFEYEAQEGDFSAQHVMGQIYERGFGVKQDYKKAIEWYKKSVEQDYNTAQYSLAVLYENGLGVEKDINKALKLYRRAAQQNNIAARMIVEVAYEGKINEWKYLKHLFFNKDAQHVFSSASFKELMKKKKMTRWKMRGIIFYWEQASFKGNQYAQYNLGRLYMLGIKMDKDYVNAYKWLFLSKRNGVRKAGYKLKYLKTLMSKEEIKEAKDLIDIYFGRIPQFT